MNRLREFRRRALLSQGRLAKLAKVTPMTISRIEAGVSRARPETQKKIAKALHINYRELFGPAPQPVSENECPISCRWCHGQIVGLKWNPAQCELIVRKMPKAVKVHKNGFFYHEDCLKEKLRVELSIIKLSMQ